MTAAALLSYRLQLQQISQHSIAQPGKLAAFMGIMQAQDYAGAKWSVALRLPGTTEEDIELAVANRQIVRTWVLRSTLHLVAPADVRWMQELVRPRLLQVFAAHYLKRELDKAVLTKSYNIITRALEGGKHLTRPELVALLEKKGITAQGERGSMLLSRAGIDGLLCLGVRRGKTQTYTLQDEWIPATKPISRDEALATLARRYFSSHGPATIQDFAWWCGLTITESKQALQIISTELEKTELAGNTYWMPPGITPVKAGNQAYLLPGFDEYLLGYKDRSAALAPQHVKKVAANTNGILNGTIIINGEVAGTWKRTIDKKEVTITTDPFTALSKSGQQAVAKAAASYGVFAGMPAVLV